MRKRSPSLHLETCRAKRAWRAMVTRFIAGIIGAISILAAFTPSASAANVGSVVVLPDAPFVLPLQRAKPNDSERDVTTQLNNNQRLGAYLAETTLTPGNVRDGSFGLLHYQHVSGQVLAQPLYVHDVDVQGMGKKNLVIVATAANMVYALDAKDLTYVFPPYQLKDSPAKVLDPCPGSHRDPSGNCPQNYPPGNTIVDICGETYPPYIGVTSTPVIDAAGFVYVESFDPNTAKHILHKLNLHDQFSSDLAVEIQPPPDQLLKGQDSKSWPMQHRNRPGLLLMNGVVYVAFASFICDNPQPYSGWVFGYTAQDLTQVYSWRSPDPTPDSSLGGSGIWQSGRGLVGSPDGTAIYFMTGNDANINQLQDHTTVTGYFHDPRLANSFVQLNTYFSISPLVILTGETTFSPKNSSQLSAGDTDLGSSGPILLPGHRLVGGGKQGECSP